MPVAVDFVRVQHGSFEEYLEISHLWMAPQVMIPLLRRQNDPAVADHVVRPAPDNRLIELADHT